MSGAQKEEEAFVKRGIILPVVVTEVGVSIVLKSGTGKRIEQEKHFSDGETVWHKLPLTQSPKCWDYSLAT